MIDQSRAVELIEQWQREQPFCPACSAPTVTVARMGTIWLECSRAGEPKSFFRRLLSLDSVAGHTRQPILDCANYQAVA